MSLACLKKKLSVLALLLFLLLLSPTLIQAQEALSLTATPVRLGDDGSLLLKPGEKKQVQVKVKNNSQTDLTVESQALDFIVGEDGTTPIPVTEEQSDRWSLSQWMTLVPALNEIKAGDTATVNVLIEVPEDALPGGHYAMVLHSPNTGRIESQTGTGVSQRLGTLLYVLVDGPITESAYVSQFNVPAFLENGPVSLEIKIKNESDVHISPTPKVMVSNIFGQEVANFNLEQKNVFPMTERDFSSLWDRKWGFGPYTVRLEAVYGRSAQVATAEAVVWLVPVKLIIVAVLVILIIVTILVAVKKKQQDKNSTIVNPEPEVSDGSVDEQKPQA